MAGTIFSRRVIAAIKKIPAGKVATYGQIAAFAGSYRASRQVAYLLHSSSDKEHLPWHRVINRRGGISLPPGQGGELQRRLLKAEGVKFKKGGTVDMNRFLWLPGPVRAGEQPGLKKKSAQLRRTVRGSEGD